MTTPFSYAIPEEEYRETGGVIITREQFQARETGRPGEMNVLVSTAMQASRLCRHALTIGTHWQWVLLFDPEWLADDDGWSKYRVISSPRP